jgi:hypothetical protein
VQVNSFLSFTGDSDDYSISNKACSRVCFAEKVIKFNLAGELLKKEKIDECVLYNIKLRSLQYGLGSKIFGLDSEIRTIDIFFKLRNQNHQSC